MIKDFKEYIRNNYPGAFKLLKRLKNPINPILYRLKFGKHGYDTMISKIGGRWRRFFPNGKSKYSRIKLLKGIHKGKRCFIISTGPSLKISDLKRLEEDVTISMNSIVSVYKLTDWRPTYYVIQDTGVAHDIMESGYELWNMSSNIIISHLVDERFIHPANVYVYRLDLNGHNVTHSVKEIEFSHDAFESICDGYTVTYSCIQLAMYMGFKEIYLLGCDCDYLGQKKHAFGYKTGTESSILNSIDDKIESVERMKASYKIAKDELFKNRVKIFNATRGGKLEVFERVDFDSLFTDEN